MKPGFIETACDLLFGENFYLSAKKNTMRLRFAQFSDLPEMQELYVNTINHVCNKDYDDAQIAVWTSSIENAERWRNVLHHQVVIIAEKNNKMVGYGTLDKGNYIDFFYIHKDFQRQGIADKILAQIEFQAQKLGASHLSSDVSITARPFFEKKGFTVLKEQQNIRKGIELINYKMEKQL